MAEAGADPDSSDALAVLTSPASSSRGKAWFLMQLLKKTPGVVSVR